jgi:hypothetical protein
VFSWRVSRRRQRRSRAGAVAGTLGPTLHLSPPGSQTSPPRAVVAANGEAIFTWTLRRFANGNYSVRAQARVLSAAGMLGAVIDFAGAAPSPGNARTGTCIPSKPRPVPESP